MKVVENSPQNARNCTILKNFLGGPCPQTLLTKARSSRHAASRHVYPESPKFQSWAPPLRNPAYAPVLYHQPPLYQSDAQLILINFCIPTDIDKY